MSKMNKWLIALLVTLALLGGAVAFWLHDEPLLPEAQTWLEEIGRVEGDSAAYYQLFGLDSPAGSDPQAAGRNRLVTYHQWLASQGPQKAMPAVDEPARLALPGDELCALAKPGCLARLRQDPAALAALLGRHDELQQRYQQMLALEDYRTLSQPSQSEPLPVYGVLMRAGLLRGTQALALAEQGDGAAAAALLQGDTRQLRIWLARADNLILKMLLVRLLQQNLDDLAVLYHAGLIPKPAAEAALSVTERSLHGAMQREFALVATGLQTLHKQSAIGANPDIPAWRLQLVFKPRMSINETLPRYLRMAEDSQLDAAAFAQRQAVVSDTAISIWRRWRNPVGAILVAIAIPDFTPYLAQLHDLDAKLALFNALGTAVPASANPYYPQARPFWDGKLQAYCFDGPLRDEQRRRCLPWLPPPG
ncbi:hypothetical protein LRS11_05680 [Pseudomonas sp. J452]|uniref:hypothetical protein n=1 Tax=Pseudomonas sp. J452 TaxID=2898441 RepID=UPI0021AE321F|nr:hypothetical protein [Pseudomonas sp. J452]UUY09527.1 hypothetical protein LRS11_05680 [Pseudomonas sp. J452]